MQVLLALKGYDKKKHTEAWDEGSLKLKPGDLSLQGTAQRWCKALVRHREVQQQHGATGPCPTAECSSRIPRDPCPTVACRLLENPSVKLAVHSLSASLGRATGGEFLHSRRGYEC